MLGVHRILRFANAGVLLSTLLFVLPALGFESDDFDRANLDASSWTFVNLLGEGFVQMSGAGTGSARIELSVPVGPSHDPYHTNRSVRVMQPIADADFILEAKFESNPTEPRNGADMSRSRLGCHMTTYRW